MRYVVIEDAKGYKRRYLVRDEDGDKDAARIGIPAGPPDINSLDLEAIKREINNSLVEQGLYSWADINKSPVGLNLICVVIKRYVAGLLKEAQALAKEQAKVSKK
jgi:predicted nuclease with TOPRIM domain